MRYFYPKNISLMIVAAAMFTGCGDDVSKSEKTTAKKTDLPVPAKSLDTKISPAVSIAKPTTLPPVSAMPVTLVQSQDPIKSTPATVAKVKGALNLKEFKHPKDATQVSFFGAGLYYQTSEDLESTIVSSTDQLLKNGFEPDDSHRTLMATVTFLVQDRPGTIFLTNSLDGNTTHVTMYHHQGIDVSSIPILPNSSEVNRRVDQTCYTSSIGVREAYVFLQTQMNKLNIPIARTSMANGVLKTFTKDGVKFVCQVETVQQNELETPGAEQAHFTRFSLVGSGNIDVSNLPMPGMAEGESQPFNALFGSYKYFTSGSANDVVKACSKQLVKAGWRRAEPIRESMADKQHLLVWNGTILNIQATGFENGRIRVDYNLSLMPFDIPGDISVRQLRVDTSAPRMLAVTSAPVQDLAEFYSDHLQSIGWKPDQKKIRTTANEHQQLFSGDYHEPLLLDIKSKDADTTWVDIRPVDFATVSKVFFPKPDSPAQIANNEATNARVSPVDADAAVESDSQENIEALLQSQMEAALKNVPADQAEAVRKMIESNLKSAMSDETSEQASEDGARDSETLTTNPDSIAEKETAIDQAQRNVPEGKIAAEEFPIPDGAERVTRDFEMITFSTDLVEPNAKFYEDSLTKLGWKPRGEQMLESDMAILKFQKGTGTITISLIMDDRKSPPVHAVIQGDGLYFEDPYAFAGDPEEEVEMDGFDSTENEFEDSSPKEFEGISLPTGLQDTWTSGSQFRKELTCSTESDVTALHKFFRNSGTESGWIEQSQQLDADRMATIVLQNDRGEMKIKLQQSGGEVDINLAFRNPALAKEHGFFPPANKGRLILANASEAEAIIVINKKEYRLKPGLGAEDPKDGIIVDLKPGTYDYSIKGAGREAQSDKLKIEKGDAWGMIVFPQQGHMAEQMF